MRGGVHNDDDALGTVDCGGQVVGHIGERNLALEVSRHLQRSFLDEWFDIRAEFGQFEQSDRMVRTAA